MGLTLAHDRRHMARAVLEGVAFNFADGVDVLTEADARPKATMLVGGGARSALWGQLIADATGLTIDLAAGAEAGAALGVARLLETVSKPGVSDNLAARRLRNELTARAGGRPRLRSARSIVPIAAAVAGVAFLSVFFWRSPARTSDGVLAARQETARAAVVAVATSWAANDALSRRLAAVSEQQWRSRLTTMIDRGRFEQLAAESAQGTVADRAQPVPRATLALPTPGGTS